MKNKIHTEKGNELFIKCLWIPRHLKIQEFILVSATSEEVF